MGYDIHITRRKDWSDDDSGAPITEAEWLALAQRDPTLKSVEHSRTFFEVTDSAGWFDLFEGNLFTKNPDSQTFRKAHSLAADLAAKVQGDDGEVYVPNGESFDPGETQPIATRSGRLTLALLFSVWCLIVAVFIWLMQ